MERLGFVDSPLYCALNPKSQISEPTRSTDPTCSRIAFALARVRGGRRMAFRRWVADWNPPAGHFCTWKTWAPRTLISRSRVPWTIEMAVMTAMMEATPATTPTRVRMDRSLLLRMAPVDMKSVSRGRSRPDIRRVGGSEPSSLGSLIAQGIDGVEARGAEGRHDPRQHPHRDQHRNSDQKDGNGEARGHHGRVENRGQNRGEQDPDGHPEQADHRGF